VRRGAALACAALACALVASDGAAAAPAVTAEPSLYPPFKTGTADYTVRCKSSTAVRFSIDPPAGTRVAVDDPPSGGQAAPAHKGKFTASVKLRPGEAAVLRFIGASRTRTHYVRCLPKDFPKWKIERDGTPTARWLIATPSLNTVASGYMIVFDDRGVPAWWMSGDPPPFNGELLPNGNLAWTNWVFSRAPLGYYVERSLDGKLVRTYDTSPRGSNPHELRVLPNGHAFLVAYRPRDAVDLSRWGGPKNATVLDGELQELDPSGNVLWSWSTKDHLKLSETKHWYPKLFKDRPVDLGNGRFAYDIAHVNSIEPLGNRVITSVRHTDAVYEIDKATGDIVWKLGGTKTPERLRITNDPHGSQELGGQHDARALDGGKTITVYDNGTLRDRPPRALAFRIDLAKRTAKLTRSVDYARVGKSTCCGSARLLPDGHWVVSWGNNSYVGELTGSGRPVLTLKFGGGRVSYRVDPVLAGRLSRAALRRGMDAMAAK
jgi:arylsulfotransferase ASST